jgi:hypothetical protein
MTTASAARHAWIEQATVALRGRFAANCYTVPSAVRVSVGFPKGASAQSHKIGQCWAPQASTDAHSEIFISPELEDGVQIIGVLAHELAHATVGNDAGHGPTFKKCAIRIGLTGKMTATTETPIFAAWAKALMSRIGDYPAGAINYASRKKQTTRLIKCECDQCGYTVRTTAKWVAVGAPICPVDGIDMTCDSPE